MAKRKPTKVVERPKTRKELRKDKRTQKKANRVHFHKRKKELKIEYRERLKQQKKDKNKKGPAKRSRDSDAESDAERAADGDDDIYDQADMSSGNESDDPNVRGSGDSDEEIESDFTLSDDELEQKFAGRVKAKPPKKPKAPPTQQDNFLADLQKEKQKQRKLEKEMRKQRVKQLRAANEDEDKMIRKLEKQLKIDKKRSEKHVPTMFNDGLEYALELCLPENIQKMYTAAKEAADNEANDSDAGFEEDLAQAMGETASKTRKRKLAEVEQGGKGAPTKQQQAKDLVQEAAAARSALKMAKLRQAESKYFDTDDELDSDLSGNDSEYEYDGEGGSSSDDQVLEVHNAHKKKKQSAMSKKDEVDEYSDDDFGLQDDENDFEDDESDEDDGDEDGEDFSDDDDEGPEEVHKQKKTKQTAPKKAGGKKQVVEEDTEEEEEEEDDFSDESDDESEPEPPKNNKKPAKPVAKKQPVAGKQKQVEPDSDDFGDGDDDFDEDVFGLSSGDEVDEPVAKKQAKSDVWEDIYGRTRDKDGNVVAAKPPTTADAAGDPSAPAKYMPPHLRARLEAAAAAAAAAADASSTATVAHPLDDDPKRREQLQRLRKQLKGYINRLSEANMHRIAADIETVYMQNSRHDVNDTLTQLLEAALVSPVLAGERMVLEHMMLVAALHANVGSEVGAHFLQRFVERLDAMLPQIDTYDVEDKRLDNVLFVLCHMYTFKLFQHTLIYEILGRLTATLTEKSVECLLLALRSIGFALRRDDAIALRDLIAVLQRKAAEAADEFKANPRLRYMLDVLLAIKNNNVNKIPSYDPALAEHLRKILRTMLVNGKYVTTLNITLADLLSAETKGKWWVVGSAWSGNVNDIGAAAQKGSKQAAAYAEATQFSASILALAKAQRMNTDDRRNVFCVLMTAEDYLDAFEKLHQLAIRDHKVIVTVLVHCCLSEKVFNPYYAVLAQKFCDFDRKYQLAVQFALWDRIREVATTPPLQVKNMARFMMHLLEHGGLALSVLKVVEFGELDKATMRLVRQVVLGVLMGKEAVCQQVFGRIAPSAKLKAFKDSLRLFLHHFLMQGGAKSGVPAEKMELLRARIRLADKALETVDSRLQF